MIDKFLENKFNELKLPGLGCAVSFKNEISHFSYGNCNLELGIMINENSIFNIASVGKLFTIISIFHLIEKKYFNLDTKIGEILSRIPLAWENVKIEHLLTHSSGIKNYTETPEYWQECRLDVPKERIIEYIKDSHLEFIPGTALKYNNTAFYLLGLIIEEVSKTDYFDYVNRIIADYDPDLNIIPTNHYRILKNRVSGYNYVNNSYENVQYYSSSGTFSAGGYSAKLIDFIRFENALFNGKILEESSLNKLYQSYIMNNGKILRSPFPEYDFEMTYGLFKFKKSGKTLLAHGGDIYGFSTAYLRIPEDNFSVIVSANMDDVPHMNRLTKDIYRLLTS